MKNLKKYILRILFLSLFMGGIVVNVQGYSKVYNYSYSFDLGAVNGANNNCYYTLKAGKVYLTNNKCYMSSNAGRGLTIKAYLCRERIGPDWCSSGQTLGTVTSIDYRYPTTLGNGTFTADQKSSKYYLKFAGAKGIMFVGSGNVCQ